MSTWAHFRKHWLKPEVYPLIGAMGAALGVCAAALINKARDPTVAWDKAKRSEGQDALLEGVDEVVPLWNKSNKNSTRIFGKDNAIMESKVAFTELPDPVTVRIGEEEEEEEEEEIVQEEQVETTETSQLEESISSDPDVKVIDETPEAIESAVEAAVAAVESETKTAENTASSVDESSAPSGN